MRYFFYMFMPFMQGLTSCLVCMQDLCKSSEYKKTIAKHYLWHITVNMKYLVNSKQRFKYVESSENKFHIHSTLVVSQKINRKHNIIWGPLALILKGFL